LYYYYSYLVMFVIGIFVNKIMIMEDKRMKNKIKKGDEINECVYAAGYKVAGVALTCYFVLPLYITILILFKKVFIKNASPYS